MRILVVEDDLALADVLRRGLQEESFTVDVSHDGEEALHLAREYTYDGIILDVMLPGRDGIAVARAARRGGDNAHLDADRPRYGG